MDKPPTVEMQQVTDADELAKARKQREQFDRNCAWLQNNISDIHAKHPGKCICVAGQEVFVADITNEAIAQATAAHPDDEGWFTRYIPIARLGGIQCCLKKRKQSPQRLESCTSQSFDARWNKTIMASSYASSPSRAITFWGIHSTMR